MAESDLTCQNSQVYDYFFFFNGHGSHSFNRLPLKKIFCPYLHELYMYAFKKSSLCLTKNLHTLT